MHISIDTGTNLDTPVQILIRVTIQNTFMESTFHHSLIINKFIVKKNIILCIKSIKYILKNNYSRVSFDYVIDSFIEKRLRWWLKSLSEYKSSAD
jgi:hypothetical protein